MKTSGLALVTVLIVIMHANLISSNKSLENLLQREFSFMDDIGHFEEVFAKREKLIQGEMNKLVATFPCIWKACKPWEKMANQSNEKKAKAKKTLEKLIRYFGRD